MSHLLVEQRDGVAIITLNRPEKRNALSPEMVVRLADFWREVATDDSVRVVVVTGAGTQAFSAGGDLGTLIPLMMRAKEPVGEWETRFAADRKQLHAAILRNSTFYKPVIAAINGPALAGGAEFVLATDLRVMSSDATLAVTEVRRGLIASGGSLVRPRRRRAARMRASSAAGSAVRAPAGAHPASAPLLAPPARVPCRSRPTRPRSRSSSRTSRRRAAPTSSSRTSRCSSREEGPGVWL
jgi:enoyl-CoA hydratase